MVLCELNQKESEVELRAEIKDALGFVYSFCTKHKIILPDFSMDVSNNEFPQ